MPTLLFAGGWEWVIILVVALLLFGGSRLAGLGKGVGRSIREFKEEVKTPVEGGKPHDEVVEAEIAQPEIRQRPVERPVDPYTQRPADPYAQGQADPYAQRPADPYAQRPAPQPEQRPEA